MVSNDADAKSNLPPDQAAGESATADRLGEKAKARDATLAPLQDVQPGLSGSSPALDFPGAEDPSPATNPIYLRPRGATPLQTPAPAPTDARTGILTGQSAALVEALTKGILQRLETTLRPVVAATVDDLLPMLLTLGSVPGRDVRPPSHAPVKASESVEG